MSRYMHNAIFCWCLKTLVKEICVLCITVSIYVVYNIIVVREIDHKVSILYRT